METSSTTSLWMNIRLALQRTGEYAAFHITFSNTSDMAQELVFSNRAHKAELLGLRLFDAQGQRVEPERKFILKPLPDPNGRRWLAPGQEWEFILEGTLNTGQLDFEATLFPLTPGEAYQAQFVYKLVPSNTIHFIA